MLDIRKEVINLAETKRTKKERLEYDAVKGVAAARKATWTMIEMLKDDVRKKKADRLYKAFKELFEAISDL